jgi:MFS family permease
MDFLRGLAMVALVICAYMSSHIESAIYILTFCVAVCNAFFQPAMGALIKELVEDPNVLLNANVKISIYMQIGMFIGSAVGGVLVSRLGFPAVVSVNAFSFFFSGLLTIGLPSKTKAASRLTYGGTFLSEMVHALSWCKERPALIWVMFVQMFGAVALAICNALLPSFVTGSLHANSVAYGTIDAGWGAGAIFGGLALSLASRRYSGTQISRFGPFALCIAMYNFALSVSVWQATFGYFFLAAVICIVRVRTDTDLLILISERHFGKIKSFISMFISYATLVVYCLIWWSGEKLSLGPLLMYFALFVLFLSLARTVFALNFFARFRKVFQR